MSEKMTTSEPTTGEIVRELETLLPPMTNCAESVCAEGAFAHSTYMVWDDPEPYIIKNGIDRLKSQEQKIADKDAKIATLTEKAEAMENDLINFDMNLTEMTARAEQAAHNLRKYLEPYRCTQGMDHVLRDCETIIDYFKSLQKGA